MWCFYENENYNDGGNLLKQHLQQTKWCEYGNNSLKGFVANDYDGDIVKAVTITQNMNSWSLFNDQQFRNCC